MHPEVAREPADNLIYNLAAKLRRQALWDALALLAPPLLAAIYVIALPLGAVGPGAAFLLFAAALALLGALLAVLWRPAPPNVATAARLLDARTAAQDHFLTLATVEPAACPAAFLSRLRRDAGGFGRRIELKRDFPYRLKSSAYWSFGLSLLGALLLTFLLPLAAPGARPVAPAERLRAVAQELGRKPELRQLGAKLLALAARLDEPKMPREEKTAQAEELKKEVQEQQKKEEQKENRELLGEAASALEGVEQQQAGGQEQKDQQKGGGGIDSNLKQEGKGQSEQSQSGSGESKGDSTAQLGTDMQQGKNSQGNPKEPGQEKNQRPGDSMQGSKPDPNRPGKEKNNEQTAKNQGGGKEGSGKEKGSEEPPQGAPPAERFYKTGEGQEGIKNAGYVTVQLPEELAADGKGETRAAKDGKGGRARNQVPLSNVPLPPHVPNAASEKQPVPIEYRGMIR